MSQATQTKAKAKAKATQAAKAAPIAQAAKAATVASRIIDSSIRAFFKNAAGNGHKGRYTVNEQGELTVSDEGAKHFAARLADPSKAMQRKAADEAMKANAPIASGKVGSRAWIANGAIINRKPVALPVFVGAGDAESQAAFARVVMAFVK